MDITIEMIEQVLDATDGDYRQIKQALIDSEGDVEKAIELVKASQAKAEAAVDPDETVVDIDAYRSAGEDESADDSSEAKGTEDSSETENKAKADWTTDEFAEDMVNKIKKKIQEGNVDHIRITRGSQTLLDIPVNLGIIGGLLGMATIPWAMILGVLAGYGVGCKVEIVNKDGGSEEL